jgi:hypothetical protein
MRLRTDVRRLVATVRREEMTPERLLEPEDRLSLL